MRSSGETESAASCCPPLRVVPIRSCRRWAGPSPTRCLPCYGDSLPCVLAFGSRSSPMGCRQNARQTLSSKWMPAPVGVTRNGVGSALRCRPMASRTWRHLSPLAVSACARVGESVRRVCNCWKAEDTTPMHQISRTLLFVVAALARAGRNRECMLGRSMAYRSRASEGGMEPRRIYLWVMCGSASLPDGMCMNEYITVLHRLQPNAFAQASQTIAEHFW